MAKKGPFFCGTNPGNPEWLILPARVTWPIRTHDSLQLALSRIQPSNKRSYGGTYQLHLVQEVQ